MEMNRIPAKETFYKGYRFRSRLEAKWAYFFDLMNIRWEYEPEGYVTKNGGYLPDFYLPDDDFYIEVKPDRSWAIKELEKAKGFVCKNLNRIMILPNIPDDDEEALFWFPVFCYDSFERKVVVRYAHIWRCNEDENGYIETTIYISRIISCRLNELKAIPDRDMNYGCGAGKIPEFDWIIDAKTGCCSNEKQFTGKCSKSPRWGEGIEGSERVREAYSKARQARFEHGEHPELIKD